MTTKQRIFRNVTWNWAGMAVEAIAGLVTAAFLVRRLGETTYGLWIVILAFTSYFGFLDLGIRGSVGRYVAWYQAKNDRRGVDATISTALAILGLAGALILLLTVAGEFIFFHIFDVPARQIPDVRIALAIVGATFAIFIPSNVFDATLWGYQRFDLLNAIDIPMAVLRPVLVIVLVSSGYGLVALALINGTTLVLQGAVKLVLTYRVSHGLRIGFAGVSREMARTLFGYGGWMLGANLTRVVRSQFNPTLIGYWLGMAMVTPYSITSRLIESGSKILWTGTGVLTPQIASLQAQENHDARCRLILVASRFCVYLALFLMVGMTLLGNAFLTLWVGPKLASASVLLSILAVGELVPNSLLVLRGALQGMARHPLIAIMAAIDLAFSLAVGIAVLPYYGLVGLCVVLAISGFVFRGVIKLVYACRLTDISVSDYLRSAVLGSCLAALIPSGLLALAVAWKQPATWIELILYCAVFTVLYLVAGIPLIGVDRARRVLVALIGRVKGRGEPSEGADVRSGEALIAAGQNSSPSRVV